MLIDRAAWFRRLRGAAAAIGGRKSASRQTVPARRISEEHLAHAQRVAAIGSFEFDLATGEIEWSDENYRIFGIEKTEGPLSFDRLIERVVPEDREVLRRTVERLERGLPLAPEEFRIRRPDGTIRTLRSELEAIRDDTGKTISLIGVDRDVTELREAERRRDELEMQLLYSQKLEALGTLAGGIAHDLNNTLVPIIIMSALQMRKAPPGSAEAEELELIHEAGVHARDLIAQILAFARRDTPSRQPLDLAVLVKRELRLLRASVPTTIAIDERIAPVPPVLADDANMRQVLMNLITNAAQAIGYRQGTITVEVAAIEISPLRGGKAALRLAVSDTGCGMDEATRRRIFDPFFTTKPIGEGTGLGLCVVHGIVASHDGVIRVESAAEQGTRFEVYFPVFDESAPGTAAPRPSNGG